MATKSKGITLSIIASVLMIMASVLSFGVITPKTYNTTSASVADLPEWATLNAGTFGHEGQVARVSGYNMADNTYTYITGDIDNWTALPTTDHTRAHRSFINFYDNLNEVERNSVVDIILSYVEDENGDYVWDESEGQYRPAVAGRDDDKTKYRAIKETVDLAHYTAYESGSYVMLHNYGSQHNSMIEEDNYGIDSFYLGLGTNYGENAQTKIFVSDIDNLEVFLDNQYIRNHASDYNISGDYGARLKINSVIPSLIQLQDGSTEENHYWYQYFDLSSVDALLTDDKEGPTLPIKDAEGLYTVTFDITYVEWIDNAPQPTSTTVKGLKYTFYLFSDTNYIEYPVFNAVNNDSANTYITEYVARNGSVADEFYNYQTEELPTLLYNATKYQVNYLHSYRVSTSYTTNFTVNGIGDGELKTYENGTLLHTTTIKLDTNKYVFNGSTYVIDNEYGTISRIEYVRDNQTIAELMLNVGSGVHKLIVHNNVRQSEITLYGTKNTPLDYYYFMQFEELGTYEFDFNYLLKLSNSNFVVIPDTAVNYLLNMKVGEALGFKALTHLGEYHENTNFIKYSEKITEIGVDSTSYDKSTAGKLTLRVFGAKPIFYKSSRNTGTKYAFQDVVNGYYADQTEYAKSSSYTFDTTENLKGKSYTKIPSTNLQPVYLDYWGTYSYNGANSNSKVFKINKGNYTIDGDTYTINNDAAISQYQYTKDLSLPIANTGVVDGLYVIVVCYTYDSYRAPSQEHKQVIVFEINNVAPKITISTKTTQIVDGHEQEVESILTNAYTNHEKLQATWEDPNYFQGTIQTSITYYPYLTDHVSPEGAVITDNYQKNSTIYSIGGITVEGKYDITLHYGLDGANSRTETVYVDRTHATLQLFSVEPTVASATEYAIRTTNDTPLALTNNLTNEPFIIRHLRKASGASVQISYRTIPFALNDNYYNEYDSISKTTGHLFDATDYQGVIIKNYVNLASATANAITNYSYDIDSEEANANVVNKELVFGTNGGCIYVVNVRDQAGNDKTYYYIYDTTLPDMLIYDVNGDEMDLDRTSKMIVKAKTTLYFGDYKVLKLEPTASTIINSLIDSMQTQMAGASWLDARILDKDNVKYLLIPLSRELDTNPSENNTSKALLYKDGYVEGTSDRSQVYGAVAKTTTKSVTIFKHANQVENPESNKWRLISDGNNTLLKHLLSYEGSYELYVRDTLGNKNGQTVEMNFDNARLQAYVTQGTYNEYQSVLDSPFNIDTLKLNYRKETTIGSDANETEVSVEVKYYYYPFAFDSYLTKDAEYPSFTKPAGEENDYPTPNYPISRVSTKNYTFNDADLESAGDSSYTTKAPLNVISGKTSQGLYVIRRAYNISAEAFNESGEEDDKRILYRIVYVDRYGIVQLVSEFDADTSSMVINKTTSVGDLIKILLGADVGADENMTTLDAEALLTFVNSTLNTNKVKVDISTPVDKWSTANKLLDSELTDYTESTEGVSNAIETNETSSFKLKIDLHKMPKMSTIIRPEDYLILNNVYQNGFTAESLRDVLINKEESYRLTIYDDDWIKIKDEYNNEQKVGAHSISIVFNISYERPNGKFNTVIDNNKIDLSEVNISYPVKFISTNKKVLEFNYTDTLDNTKADIDNTYILVEKTSGAWTSSSVWETIFGRDGDTYINPLNIDIDEIFKDYETSVEGKYKHVLTIFNNDSINNLSPSEDDASYRVTLHFVGSEDNYRKDNGDTYYSNSFIIYVDHKNPENNLNWLKENDKAYNGQDLDKFYFAVNNGENPTIFTTLDRNDSDKIYLRSLGSDLPTVYYKSAVNGEVLPAQHPIFSVYSNLYDYKPYNNDNQLNFATIASGYYEVVECDEAGNATVYLIFVSNNDNKTLEFKYNGKDLRVVKTIVLFPGGDNYQDDVLMDSSALVNKAISLAYSTVIDSSLIDKFCVVNISSGDTELLTLRSHPNELGFEFNNWLEYIVDSLVQLNADNVNLFDFKVEFINRFGENYILDVRFSGNELMLNITVDSGNKTVKVIIPGEHNGVNLDQLDIKTWKNNAWINVSTSQSGSIDTYNEHRETTTYIFASGQYQFETWDNFGRYQVYYAYAGDATNTPPTINYGEVYQELDKVVYTAATPVTMIVNKDLWKVTIRVNGTQTGATDYYSSYTNPITNITTYSFNYVANDSHKVRFDVDYKWATGSDISQKTYSFIILDVVPEVELIDINGTPLSLGGVNTFTRDFYITFDETLNIENEQYGTMATLTLGNMTRAINSGYMINVPGTYTLTLRNAVGAKISYVFTREDNNFTYYTVKATRVVSPYDTITLTRSDYTTINESDNASVHHYFVLDSYTAELIVDSNENYEYTLVEEDDSYQLYMVYKTAGNAICYVQINIIETNSSFAQVTLSHDGSEIQQTYPVKVVNDALGQRIDKVTLTVPSYNSVRGNYISVNYYYNTTFVRTITNTDPTVSEIEFTFSRAGLHTFEVLDLAGNKLSFGTFYALDVYLLNDIVFKVNNDTPIPNRVYNGTVDITMLTHIKRDIYKNATLTATRNGSAYTPVVLDNIYRFTQAGYYTITMTAEVDVDSVVSIVRTTVYNFAITYDDNAHLSFNIPSSQGFNINKVLLNSADITSRFEDKSSLWLSMADTGNGLYTIYTSYYLKESNETFNYSFRIWINEETPVIIPVNYTYGTKTSKQVELQYNAGLIYEQIGSAKVVLVRDGNVVYTANVDSTSRSSVSSILIAGTKEAAGTYYAQIYDANDRLIVSYKIIKSVPLNSSAKIIIFIASGLALAGIVVFIILRRHTRFK